MNKFKIEGFIYNKNVELGIQINRKKVLRLNIKRDNKRLISVNNFAGSLIFLYEKTKYNKISFKLNIYEFKRKFPIYHFVELNNGYLIILQTKDLYIMRLIYNSKRFFDKGYIYKNKYYGEKVDIEMNLKTINEKKIDEYHKGLIQQTFIKEGKANIILTILDYKDKIKLEDLKSFSFFRSYN